MNSLPDELDDDDFLTQYGRLDSGFRTRPRMKDLGGISLLAGRVSPAGASQLVRRRKADRWDGVRYTTAGRLRMSGFRPRRDPIPLNPDHVLVEYEGEWTSAVEQQFDSCFEKPVFEGQYEDE